MVVNVPKSHLRAWMHFLWVQTPAIPCVECIDPSVELGIFHISVGILDTLLCFLSQSTIQKDCQTQWKMENNAQADVDVWEHKLVVEQMNYLQSLKMKRTLLHIQWQLSQYY